MANADIDGIDFPGPFEWPADGPVGWADFFRRWEPQAASACRDFRLQDADRDDVMQRVRGTLHSKWAGGAAFDTNARFAAFVRQTARGLCLTLLTRHRAAAELPPDVPDHSDTDEFADIYPIGLSPDRRFEWLVGQAVEADREILRLRFVEGLEFAEIGRRLKCSQSTAFARSTRALIRLRRRLTHDTR